MTVCRARHLRAVLTDKRRLAPLFSVWRTGAFSATAADGKGGACG